MRIVFAGTAEFAVPAFEAVAASRHDLAAVVTQPDRPAGRHRRAEPGPVKRAALDRGLDVLQPERIAANESRQALADLAPDALVVVAYGQILRRAVLDIPRLGAFNLHGSLLPALRGAAPVNWAVIRGLSRTGVTVIRMDEGVDTGDIVAQAATAIGLRETAGELSARLARLGADLLVRALDDLDAGTAAFTPQNDDDASEAPKLEKNDGAIDWSKPAFDVDCFVRGVTPWPGAFTAVRRAADPDSPTRFAIHTARQAEGRGEPGAVIGVGPLGLTIACGIGAVVLEQVQPAGKRTMTAADFINGYRLAIGDRCLPIEDLHHVA